MLKEPVILKETVTYESEAKIIEINDTFSLFEATYKTIKNGKVVDTESSTGFAYTEHILRTIEHCRKVNPLYGIFLLTPETKRLLRYYGFPNHSQYSQFINPETKEQESPLQLFLDELSKQDLSMKYFVNNPDKIHDLVVANHAELTLFEAMSGKLVNHAIHADRFNLSSSYVANFENAVNKLIDDKKLAYSPQGLNQKATYFVPGNGNEVNGYINFTDEEYELILEESNKRKAVCGEEEKESFRFYEFSQLAFEKNWLGISEYYHGYEAGEVISYHED